MQTEVEVKFLDIDPAQIRAKLTQLGAKLVAPERLMRRRNIESPFINGQKAWVRVRDENDRVTMSYKQTTDLTVHGTQEVNLGIDDFAAGQAFLQAIGLTPKSYQET